MVAGRLEREVGERTLEVVLDGHVRHWPGSLRSVVTADAWVVAGEVRRLAREDQVVKGAQQP